VLVERMIHKIVEEQVDIDKLLVVTFTNAAASEMRERILEAIYKKLEEDPGNIHLQKQITLLNRANICTIHAFCLDVIKNNFFEIDTSANFRIGDTAEMELLKQDVLEDIFEEQYLEKEEGFLDLLDTYTSYREDTPLKEMVLGIYTFMQSSPFPEEWLQEKVAMFQINEQDFANTLWGKIVMEEVTEEIEDAILQLKGLQKEMVRFDEELLKYIQVIQCDIAALETLQKQTTWDSMAEAIACIEWKKWPVDKKVTLEIKEEAKTRRDAIKKKIKQLEEKYFAFSSEEAACDIQYMAKKLENLQKLVTTFSKAFAQKKKERNILDFNDIEHFALQILVKRTEEGTIEETEVAKRYKQKFVEIAVDEYQDSNLVQEYILSSISTGKNMFMVGDVKQSIYKFRQARPDLFMKKYTAYAPLSDKQEGENIKIQLFKNFRSRKNILDVTNLVFENIMSKALGEMEYTEEEYLNLGAQYAEPNLEGISYAGETEIHIIDVKEPEADTTFFEEEEEEAEALEKIEDVVVEAKFVAHKMKELLENHNYYVWDKKKGYRKITYKDIAVLLRSTQTAAPIYEKEIASLGIPVFCDSQTGYLDSMEVQTIVSLLKIIDNPMQDIPLVHVLRSSIGGFTDNELVQIRLVDKQATFYEAMQKALLQLEEEALKEKVQSFLSRLEYWRRRQEYDALDTFLWYLYQDTNFYAYVGLLKNGAFRQANLKILFEKAKQYEKASFKGLFHFIHFIEKLHTSNGDFGAAKLIGENENVVRIMSIHKSKGLEFPVVFLCGTGKQMNMQDLTQNIVLHPDVGLGPKYKNTDTKVEYSTLAKEAIKIGSKRETISEEMRVLYVALTRAREKLIITGLDKKTQKSLEEKASLLSMYPYKGKIDSKLVKKYKRYLDWLELVYLQNKEQCENWISMHTYTKKEWLSSLQMTEEVEEKEVLLSQFKKEAEERRDVEAIQKWERMLSWEYPYRALCDAPTKTSVTQLKEWKNETKKEEEKIPEVVPKFLKPELTLSSAKKGTIMHLCLQKLEEKKTYTKEELQAFVKELQDKGILLAIEAESVSIPTLYAYVQSSLYAELQEAKEVHKEQPFYISVPVQQVKKEISEEIEENVLVQGMIDLYYIDKEGRLVLVDYKTDYFTKGQEQVLVKKYKEQLYLYKKALEEALHRKVDRMYIEALGRCDGEIVSILVE